MVDDPGRKKSLSDQTPVTKRAHCDVISGRTLVMIVVMREATRVSFGRQDVGVGPLMVVSAPYE